MSHKEKLIARIKELQAILAKLLLARQRPTALTPLVLRRFNELKAKAADMGVVIRMTDGFRTFERQNELYASGRTKPGPIVTNAKGGQSLHNYGVAFDIVIEGVWYDTRSPLWARIGSLGESLGLTWGGRWSSFPDFPHFQLTLEYSLQDFQNNKVDYSRYA